MVNAKTLSRALGNLALLKFFPSDENAQAALARMLGDICATDAQVDWLARRAIQVYREWPGALELRALASSKFMPADGIEAYSSVYPDGIPSEKESRGQIAGPEMKALPGGVENIADPFAAETITEVAEACTMPAPKPFRTISESEERVMAQLERMGV